MYVCVCNAVTERNILHKLQEGCRSLESIQFETGVGTCCGQCLELARQMILQASTCCQTEHTCRCAAS